MNTTIYCNMNLKAIKNKKANDKVDKSQNKEVPRASTINKHACIHIIYMYIYEQSK